MRKISLIVISLLISFTVYAQDIYLRQNRFFTELVIAGAAENVRDVKKEEQSLTLSFKTRLRADFPGRLNDRFISKITAAGDTVSFDFNPDTDFVFITEGVDVKIVASRRKKLDDIKLGYGIEDAIIRRGSGIIENAEAERQLGMIDEMTAKGGFEQAIPELERMIASDINSYYRQEVLFRLGNAYMAQGEKSYLSYITASQIFDDFANLYPDSYRFREALLKSAEAKEKADMYYEAIFAHEKIIRVISDPAVQKNSYLKIADIYQMLGQPERSIATRETYIRRFKEDQDPQTAVIAMLHEQRGDTDTAFRHFQSLTGRRVDYSKFPAEALYEMGNVFDKRNRDEEALNAYRRVYGFYPQSSLAGMSMYRAALMLEKLKRNGQIDAVLLEAIEKHPTDQGGMLAALKYAETHLTEKTTADWEKFLENALKSDDFQILEKAHLIIIRSLYNEESYAKALDEIIKFGRRSYSSPLMAEVFDIEQRILLAQAGAENAEGRFDAAQEHVQRLLKDFPETPYRREAKTIDQAISLGKTQEMYDLGNYRGVTDFIENFLTDELEVIEPAKWATLLDNAHFAKVKHDYETNQIPAAIAGAKQYLTQFEGSGAHLAEVREIAEQLTLTLVQRGFDNGRYMDAIQSYTDNQQIINDSADGVFKDAVRSYTAFSLYKMSLPDEAENLMALVGENKIPAYWLTSLMLGNGEIKFQVNALTPETLVFIAAEAEKNNPDTALKLLKEYTEDPKLSARQRFRITKNIPDEAKRELLLSSLYQELNADPAKRFDGYEEVALDMGILLYKKNSFRAATETLTAFLQTYRPRDDKRAEALYFTGKSYLKLNDNDNAVKNYIELLESVPNSVYASAARTELEDIQWRKSLTN